MTRALPFLRILVPTLWFGMILALSFVETPLKFLAPGITIPVGLGLGRIIFIALAIAGWFLLIVTTLVSVRRAIPRGDVIVLALLWVVLAVQTFVIRPPLNVRSDITIAGGDPGESILHYVYIASDLILLSLLLVWIVRSCKQILAANIASPAAR